jgi:hypothetical protein
MLGTPCTGLITRLVRSLNKQSLRHEVLYALAGLAAFLQLGHRETAASEREKMAIYHSDYSP